MKYTEVCRTPFDRNKIIPIPPQPDLFYHKYEGSMFYSVFEHTEEYFDYVKKNKSVEGYKGAVSSDFLIFDLDGNKALEDTRKILRAYLNQSPDVSESITVFYSGSKGFHIFLPSKQALNVNTPKLMKIQAGIIAKELGLSTYDPSLYKRTGIIRALNSKHEKTGYYKIPLYGAEVFVSDLDRIKYLAQKKRNLKDVFTIKEWISYVTKS